MEHICFDIMEMIGKQYTIIKETEKNKKLFSNIIQNELLDEVMEFWIDYNYKAGKVGYEDREEYIYEEE
jgi:hypothetical protein